MGCASSIGNANLLLDSLVKTTKNEVKTFELYSKAAEAGNTNAQYNLALCYANGEGTTKDLEKAFEFYSKAAEAGNTNAQYNLALCYANGKGTKRNSEKAFKLYSKAAEAGNTNAQYALGWCYEDGRGTTKNSEEAFELYSKAAKAGHLNAQFNLALCYANGEGTTKNEEKAFELYSKAAEAGNTNAQYNLALCYANGKGTKRNSEKAFEFYSKAVEAGIKNLENWGIQVKNLYKRYSKIPDSDNISVLYNLGWCYQNGLGTAKNLEKAFELYFFGVIFVNHHDSQRLGCREYLEWISPNEMIFLDQVGTGGFGVVKEGRWERGKILFWDKKTQKHERGGVTKVALKCFKNSQNLEYINSNEFIAHLHCAFCKYILEFYGITKDVVTNEFVMILPFAEHGDLRAFLKMNNDTFTWDMFLRILFQIAGGLRFIHDSKLVHGDLHPGNILVLKLNPLKVVISDLGFCRPADYAPQSGKIYGVLEYLAPEICKGAQHTKYSDIYSFTIVSCEIISGERPLNNTDPIYIQFDVIDGKRPIIKKHTPQCIQEMIQKNWQYDQYGRDSAEELQQTIISARDNCNLNEPVREKRLNSEEIQDGNHNTTRYKSQLISSLRKRESASFTHGKPSI
ncbi:hypothetical protein G9A89_004615 [Geosiphon pyriformis]|nr:hypothetical protein G9A89_004615 [Geosiphon pyriformis]